MKLTTRKERALQRKIDSLTESLKAAQQRVEVLESENASLQARISDERFARAENALQKLKADYENGLQASRKAKEKYDQMYHSLILTKRKYKKEMDDFFAKLHEEADAK